MSDDITSSPEFKKALKDAVEEATSGLIAKRDELLAEVRQLKKGRAIDPADVEKLENERDEWKAKAEASDKSAKKAIADVEKATKAAADADAREQGLLIDNGLTEALNAAGVTNPAHAKAAKALLRPSLQVVAEGDKRIVKAGDKALAEHVKEWAAGDEGKHFVIAAPASGGGSQGGHKGGGAAKSVTRTQWDSMSHADRAEHSKAGGTVTDG